MDAAIVRKGKEVAAAFGGAGQECAIGGAQWQSQCPQAICARAYELIKHGTTGGVGRVDADGEGIVRRTEDASQAVGLKDKARSEEATKVEVYVVQLVGLPALLPAARHAMEDVPSVRCRQLYNLLQRLLARVHFSPRPPEAKYCSRRSVFVAIALAVAARRDAPPRACTAPA